MSAMSDNPRGDLLKAFAEVQASCLGIDMSANPSNADILVKVAEAAGNIVGTLCLLDKDGLGTGMQRHADHPERQLYSACEAAIHNLGLAPEILGQIRDDLSGDISDTT